MFMINLRSEREIAIIEQAARISAQALKLAGEFCVEGITTFEIDENIRKFILSQGAVPNFLNYEGYPASSCISVNDTIIHGIPSKKIVLKKGDIVSVDVGAEFEGYNGDNAYTFKVGEVSDKAAQLLEATENALLRGIEQAVAGNRIGDISNAIEQALAPFSYGIIREFVGHGVGQRLHESPEIPNYGNPHTGPRLVAGMVLAIEPMVSLNSPEISYVGDWEVKTADGGLAAHFEHTVLVTEKGARILTKI